MSKFCPNCGSPMNDDALFCGSCGYRASAQPADSSPVPEPVPVTPVAEPVTPEDQNDRQYSPTDTTRAAPAESPKKSKLGLIVGLCIGGVIIAAITVILILFLPKWLDKDKDTSDSAAAASSDTTDAPQETEAPTEPAEIPAENRLDSPENILAYYQSEVNKVIKDGVEMSEDVADTTFEMKYIKGVFKPMLDSAIPELNKQLSNIYDDDFRKKYGPDVVEELEVDNYEVITEEDLGLDTYLFDMPEIEEVRSYDITAYLVTDTERKSWDHMTWKFVKADGKWYLVVTKSNMV